MTIQRMDNVGIVFDDLKAAIAFFLELGLELEGETTVEGPWTDRTIGLDGVKCDIAMLRTPDGHARLELSKFHAPPVAAATSRTSSGATKSARGRPPPQSIVWPGPAMKPSSDIDLFTTTFPVLVSLTPFLQTLGCSRDPFRRFFGRHASHRAGSG